MNIFCAKYRKNQGFILLMTLLSITVISLLLLTFMQHILLYYKAIDKRIALHQNFYQLEDLALQLASKRLISISSSCIIHGDSANQVVQDLLDHKGCFFTSDTSKYIYLIEDLGGFPCLVTEQNGQKFTTYHTRVSIAQIEEEAVAQVLQIRFIRPGSLLNCLAKERWITLGVSSWRYFPSIYTLQYIS